MLAAAPVRRGSAFTEPGAVAPANPHLPMRALMRFPCAIYRLRLWHFSRNLPSDGNKSALINGSGTPIRNGGHPTYDSGALQSN